MSGISESIEKFILAMLKDGSAELQRNKLANEFGCAPSQINYVLSTRFTVQRGYVVESRRGGGGYIKVLRIPDNCDTLILSAACQDEGQSLSRALAYDLVARMLDCGAVDVEQALIMKAALSDEALGAVEQQQRNSLRADIFQSMAKALAIINKEEGEEDEV